MLLFLRSSSARFVGKATAGHRDVVRLTDVRIVFAQQGEEGHGRR